MLAFMGGYWFFLIFILPLILFNEVFFLLNNSRKTAALWTACFGGADALAAYLEKAAGVDCTGMPREPVYLLGGIVGFVQDHADLYGRCQKVYLFVVALPGILVAVGLYLYVFITYVVLESSISGFSLGLLEALPGIVVAVVVALLLPAAILGSSAKVMEKLKDVAESEMRLYLEG